MDQTIDIDTGNLRDDIERLEARIESLTSKVENCRKLAIAGWLAVLAGGGCLLLIPLLIFALGVYVNTLLVLSVVAVIGGIVVAGSNRSTAKEAAAELAVLQSQCSALVYRLARPVSQTPSSLDLR